MRNIFLIIVVLLFGIAVGVVITNMYRVSTQPAEISNTQHEKIPLYWVAPMDPGFRSDKPGKSPMGMELIPVYGDADDSDYGLVKIAPEVVNNLGVRTTQVRRGPLARKMSTVGYLDYDETRISHIHTRTEGWIERLIVRAEGEQVKAGQLLFELYAPALVNAQEEYLQALAAGNNSLAEASSQRLLALGVSSSQVSRLQKNRKVEQYVKFYAPQSGVLSRLNVREGMYIKPVVEVMALANLDKVWLLAEVFERQATWVQIGQKAEAILPSLPGRVWTGEVEFIYPDLDPVTRTLRVRMRFDNTERLLMTNMYAHVDIFAEAKNDVLSIPSEALIRGVGNERVILALGEGRFEPRKVTAGTESGNSVEIIEGLEEGENIVVSSQFLIDSESSLRASFRRMQPMKTDMDNDSEGMQDND